MHHLQYSWSILVLLTLLKFPSTDGELIRESKKNLHKHMSKREIEYYFGVKDHSEIPEYDVSSPHQTEANGRRMSRFRRRRSVDHPDVLHYNLHAFGSKLQLRLKRNLKLMTPNFVIETHHGGGLVTTQPAPKNKFYLGKVSSDPDSLVAVRSNKGLSGMIRTSDDFFFVQPLPAHLAKRVRRNTDTTPHLIYRLSPRKADAGCQTKTSGNERAKRSAHERNVRSTDDTDNYKYLEAALVVPKSYEEKYGAEKFKIVLLVIANLVAGMFQDPSIGKIKVYYAVTKIIVLDPIGKAGFSAGDSNSVKLNKLARHMAPEILKAKNDPEQIDVFSYVSNKIPVGGLANVNLMCYSGSGNVQADLGLQTALHIAHEIGHNFGLAHDQEVGCKSGFIMDASLPSGVYAATWSDCSRVGIQKFLSNKNRSRCLDDEPIQNIKHPQPTLPGAYHGKLPGQIFSGNEQCEMQYGSGWVMSPYQKGVCGTLYCFKDGTQLSNVAPVVDGSTCGVRQWCIGGKCVDNGRRRIDGGWTSWGSVYSSCTRPCGGGVQYRSRVCRDPVPSNGGSPCKGPNKEWKICNSQACPEGSNSFRKEQCLQNTGLTFHYMKQTPCALWCKTGPITASPYGNAADGTRCTKDQSSLDVCIAGSCRRVGCDHVLDSDTINDRCGKCNGDGDTCFIVKKNYTTAHTVKGPENADLITRLPVGAFNVVFLIRKATNNYLGVQADNGTLLVGGGTNSKDQVVLAANTSILYTRRKAKFKDLIRIQGPTNAILRVVYVAVKGGNPGVDYGFGRPVIRSETPPEKKFEWKISEWSSCSQTCGKGVRTRTVRCIRSDDKTPASDAACGKKPDATEQCQITPCPSSWYITPWSDCSQSCGRGVQKREVKCRMKINPTDYGPSTNCSVENKPNVTEKLRYCNSIACLSDWDTEEGFDRGKCGEPFKKKELKCYHVDQFGEKSKIPNLLCRNRQKPTRLPCTTTPPPTTPTDHEEEPTTKKDDGKHTAKTSQSIQAHSSVLLAFLFPLIQILLECMYFITS